ncbi:MAG: hypothetical protein JWQ38_599 [Flavipsychrobacter sp.]|nr:hypothetical protein [Flavipsychrobacter sp.]
MKNLIAILLIAAACSSCGNSNSKASGKEKEMLKEVFVKNCMNSADKSNEQLYNAMKTYCDCAGEKVVNKFTKAEMAAFDGMPEAEMEAKLTPVIEDCLSDLKKEMGVTEPAAQ